MVSMQSRSDFQCHQSRMFAYFGNVKENLIVDLLDAKIGLPSLKKTDI